MRWEKVRLCLQEVGGVGEACPGPGKRWGHTCNSIKGGRFLYVFGGYGKDNCQTNQVHVFDTAKQTWSQPVMKGTPPTPRDSHSCTTVGDNLFVFGGTDGMNPLKDLHILDTATHTWICPSVRGEGPQAREGHSAALVGKRLFIFGGCGKSSDNNDEIYYNDLYILNTETFVWKRGTTSGDPPSARDSHTCSSWKNKIIVIGGEDGNDYYLSDVHILDADTLAWKELNTSGQILPPRAGHSSVAIGKNLFVFGGFTDAQNLYDDLYMLDVDTGMWTRVITVGDGPSARFSVAGDCLDPLKSGVLVFIGGCNKTLEALDDMYYLYTGLVVRDERKPENLSLRKQLKLKCQEQNLSNLVHDKAVVRIEVGNDVHQPIPLSSYGQPRRENIPLNQVLLLGKKTFQAKVTESFAHGYTIETVIDGKPLRGILFANKPSSIHVANHNFSRKRTTTEVGGTVLNGDCNTKSKSSRSMRQDFGDHKQADVREKDSSLHETEAPAPVSRNPAPSDLSTHKDPANQEPLVAHLNLNDDKAGDAPNSDSEFPEGIGSPRAGCSVTLSPRQDERRPNTLEHNNPGKSL
ncbi:kelch domain-containing protein 3 isoform X2 [Herrania umbratica]|uniref:Kelch domain-containing protein 3 isoform X2 n=1 Tax=Herrania umbratica TaxID=108875 RepID=A0A6J1AH70_9ROSI|nr:kelch domain-containing protein 3 isoform X2 [Herrania umbratica]